MRTEFPAIDSTGQSLSINSQGVLGVRVVGKQKEGLDNCRRGCRGRQILKI